MREREREREREKTQRNLKEITLWTFCIQFCRFEFLHQINLTYFYCFFSTWSLPLSHFLLYNDYCKHSSHLKHCVFFCQLLHDNFLLHITYLFSFSLTILKWFSFLYTQTLSWRHLLLILQDHNSRATLYTWLARLAC